MTHKDLVKRAVSWLSNNQRCTIVTCERGSSYNGETPDAIGFKGGFSILVECKTSRADFFRDKKKFFRVNPWSGMGQRRYMMAPKGLIKPNELPRNWGLLEVTDKQVRVKVEGDGFDEVDKQAEVAHLVSFIRRLEIASAVFVIHEPV